ncbi:MULTISPECIES: helix-turn-helix domain-containing protein [Fusobacterium]|jgi:transcriptional regulator with XRE-family HTH domain|uniref:helix-turn-helix domain-containing protein n=1 Tax=Fusobacterium TaxID=848 RepID=UPI0015A5598E|nr:MULTISPECIES: helix-turn-helix transcriptional regulator [Fusobacterium]MCF2612306.1 helix-turn-helix transcriptional regulator [Fusobacterium perfoetens]MDY2981231.1 helix-turn-helix transcriptional regulator [Fusobacterium sp.]
MQRTRLSLVLKELRNSRGLTIKKLSELSGVGNGTIGDIESGKSRGSQKTLDILSETLKLTKKERNRLDSAFLGRNIVFDTDKTCNLSKNQRIELNDFLQDAILYFQNEKISDEDKAKLFESLQEAYFEIKLANKRRKK